jgi:phosphatidylinositol-4,5-bisphosphate 3-kinase
MCTKNGYFFHIDFGRFLGNSEKFAGVSRDRAPFVFTPEFLFAMGGAESPHYKQFVELSCKAFNVVRKNANVFINLFAMMLQTGIPELRKEDDINYLRDAFALELSEDEAAKRFEELIDQSVKTKAVQWNNFIHIAANNKPAED